MRLLTVSDPKLALGVRGGRLVIRRGAAEVQVVSVHELEEVHLYGDVGLTAAARNLLMLRDVDVLFLTRDGRWRGRIVGKESAWARRRVDQYRLHLDPDRRLEVGRGVLRAKLNAQRDHLLARRRHRPSDRLAEAATALRAALRRLGEATSPEELLGIEGMAAKRYLGVWDELLVARDVTWTGRSRRPPRDPVNAALSYGYTLLLARVEAAVRRGGMDLHLGMLHGTERGAPALALDLMEPWRPWVDRGVITAFNRRELVREDFEAPGIGHGDDEDLPEDAVFLNATGRRIVLTRWDRDRRAVRSTDGEARRHGLDGALDEAVHALRRFAAGDDAAFLTWRPVL